jgi:hypothetical protein
MIYYIHKITTYEREVNTMGTINYETGDIITLGLQMDFDIDEEYYNELVEDMGYTEEEAREVCVNNYVEDAEHACQDIIDDMFDDVDETFFDIHIKYGYYEGFCVVVNRKYMTNGEIAFERERGEIPPYLLDLWTLEEEDIKTISDSLHYIGMGLKKLVNWIDVCYPSWCTKFEHNKAENYRAIDKAIEEAKEKLYK